MENKENKITKGEKTMENQFKITEKVLEAYERCDDYGKEILEGIFGKEAFLTDIKDKIKTFVDAIEMLGINNQSVKDYLNLTEKPCSKDIIAFARLKVIAEALNEGWKPKYDILDGSYFTSFDMINKEEYERLNEDEKNKCIVFDIPNQEKKFALVSSKLSVACEGYKLAFKSRELAEYCGKQFIGIWKDYLFD